MFNKLKKNVTAGKYIGSGLLKTVAQTLSGFIVLRWLAPEDLGQWQSFTVFVVYLNILTLGVTDAVHRELPYWFGKGKKEKALEQLRNAGYFITRLSLGLVAITILVALLLNSLEVLTTDQTIMLIFAFTIGAAQLQVSFLSATFRTSNSFDQLSKIQVYYSILCFCLLPVVYFFDIWGYIAYQVLLVIILFLGSWYFRPFKIPYAYAWNQLKGLIKIGFPIYFWTYLSTITTTVPRLVLVLFGTPYLVGLFAPANSINAAMFKLPTYINRYLYPQMSFQYGKHNDLSKVFRYALKSAGMLLLLMLFGAILVSILLPYLFSMLFPQYIDGVLAAQITIFSGVFYSISLLFHYTLNSIKSLKFFKFIIGCRIVFILLFTGLSYYFLKNLLLAVALGAVLSEFFNMLNYFYFLRKATHA